MTVRHILLDADDVLQVGHARFRPELEEVFGEDLGRWLRETFHPEADALPRGVHEGVPDVRRAPGRRLLLE